MTIQSAFPMTDLVLRLTGGQRDGELIPVSTNKCFLGMEEGSDGAQQTPQCAIFRGPKGAAVKSYGNDILVNGVPVTVQWLQEGDRIEFPNSMAIEVAQLGWVNQPCEEYKAVESATIPLAAPESDEVLGETGVVSDEFEDTGREADGCNSEGCQNDGCQDAYYQEQTIAENTDNNWIEEGLGSIETQTAELDQQNGQTEERFDNVESQLGQLGDQLSTLGSSAGSNKSPESSIVADARPESFEEVETERFATFGSEEPQVEESQDVEIFNNELPASEDFQPDEEVFVNEFSADQDVESDQMSQGLLFDDSDEEKIMTYDSDESEAEPAADFLASGRFKNAVSALNGASQGEIDAHLAEMERVFGGQLADFADDSEALSDEQNDDESKINQPANEQLAESFETKSHSLDEEVASFADNSLPSEETFVTQGAASFPELPQDEVSLAKKLIMEVDQAEEQALEAEAVEESTSQETTVGEAAVEEAALEEPTDKQLTEEETEVAEFETPCQETVAADMNTEASPSANSPATSSKNESVSELLARMKAEGQWDGIPDEDLEDKPVEPVNVEPVAEVAEEPSLGGENSGEDVNDYMSQLLSRMRGDKPAPTQSATATYSEKPKQNETTDKEELKFVPPVNPLKPDEFKPKQKAKPISSLNAMRELANSSARSAVHKSEKTRRKALGIMQMGIAIAAFLMACYYFLVASTEILDASFIVGIVCIGICGFICVRFYLTMRHNEILADAHKSKKQDATEEQAEN